MPNYTTEELRVTVKQSPYKRYLLDVIAKDTYFSSETLRKHLQHVTYAVVCAAMFLIITVPPYAIVK